MTKLLACLPALAALLGMPAHAQTAPTPAGASALQRQIQAALAGVAGNKAPLPDTVARVNAEGDHYQLSVTLAPLIQGFQPAEAAFTAMLRPLASGGLTIDHEQFPSEFEITPHQPTTPAPTYQVKLGAQDEHATLDPSGQMASSSGGSIASADIVKTGGVGASLTHLGRISNQSSTRPSSPGHYDLLADVAVEGYAVQFADANAMRSEVTAERLHVSTTMTGVSAAGLQQVSMDLSHAPKSTGKLTTEQRAQLRQVVLGSKGLLTGAEADEEADGVKFDLGGHAGGVRKVELSFSGQAPQDMLSASMGMTIEGLALDDLPPAFAAYLPSRIVFHPTASNLDVADVTMLVLDSLAPDAPVDPATGKPLPPLQDYQALFSHGGLQIGFDQLALDVAGAQFAGTGSFTMTGPQAVNGAAQITGSGLDGLITRLQADPAAAQLAPLAILLKGIAKTTPDGSVWQVTVQDHTVLVNGIDLGAMAAAMR